MALDAATLEDTIRFHIGDPDTDTISSVRLQYIIQIEIDDIGDDDTDECTVTYQSVLNTLLYLSKAYQVSAASSGTQSGRKESNGKRSVEVDYDTDSDSSDNPWQSMYLDFLQHPEWICSDLVSKDTANMIYLGGTEQKQYDAVNSNPNSRNPYQLNVGLNYRTPRVRGVRGKKGYWTV